MSYGLDYTLADGTETSERFPGGDDGGRDAGDGALAATGPGALGGSVLRAGGDVGGHGDKRAAARTGTDVSFVVGRANRGERSPTDTRQPRGLRPLDETRAGGPAGSQAVRASGLH